MPDAVMTEEIEERYDPQHTSLGIVAAHKAAQYLDRACASEDAGEFDRAIAQAQIGAGLAALSTALQQ